MLLILLLMTTANAFSRFGCKFDTENYAPSADQPSLSSVRSESIYFSNDDEFNDFYDKVDVIRRNEVKGTLFNTLDPFITMFEDYSKADSKYHVFKNIPSLSDFYESYIPTYPSSGDDGIPALFRVYEKLVELDGRVEDSFVLASKDLDVDDKVFNKLVQNHNATIGSLPPRSFQHDQLVGLIGISVAGELGYILIDLNEPKAPTPVVMHRQDHELNRDRYEKPGPSTTFDNYKATFHYNNEYISIASYNYRKIKADEYKDELIRKDLLFTPRSLCSFLESTVKRSLFNPVRHLEKFLDSGTSEASVKLNVLDDVATLFTLNYMPPKLSVKELDRVSTDDLFAINVQLNSLANGKLNESEKTYIESLKSHFKFTGDTLEKKLHRFYTIIHTNTSQSISFRQAFDDIHRRLQKPAEEKFTSKVIDKVCGALCIH